MHSISSCGLDIRKTKSIQYQLARKVAKLRAWSYVFEEDKIKGDAKWLQAQMGSDPTMNEEFHTYLRFLIDHVKKTGARAGIRIVARPTPKVATRTGHGRLLQAVAR